MTDFTLRPLTVPERKYTYAQSSQLQGQTGNIGYLRGDFGSSGDQFYTTWFDTRPQWKSDEFKRDLDDVINALRSEEYGLLQSRSQMVRYGRENKESEMQGAYTTEFGFRADTEKYAFVLRCNPTRGDYGFRPNHSAENAIAQAERMIQNVGCHYVIDIDIKSFFDNVNHGKLLKQMWTLGIRDKKLLSIISAMLKAEVAGIGFPEKGTPQGGIISPLLSNIVLNELDWWIVSQWEEMPTQRNYVHRIYANGTPDKSSTIRTLRNYTNLKECYVVRYADDFKIFCKKRSDAIKLFEATKQWLLDRLGLKISPEKSKIVNLKRHYSEFLGFKLKVRTKGKKPDGQPRYVVEAHIKDKALQKIREKSKEIIGQIRQTYDPGMEYRLIQKYNSYVMGVHNYYSIATHVNIDFHKIAFDVKKSLYNRLKHRLQKKGQITNRYIKEKYGTSREVRYLNGHAIVPIAYVQHRVPMDKKSRVNKYTPEGRVEIHKNLAGINMAVLYHLMNNPCGKQSVEYNDNRIALYVAQKGKCAVSGAELGANQVDCHHKKPLVLGGNDSYQNLIIVSDVVHILIHSSNERTIRKYLKVLNPDKKQLAKLNKLRVMAEMPELVF